MPGKVLVADDTDVNQAILAGILRKAGIASVLASSGDEALRLARSEKPDLILLDVMMPGKDGFAVLEELKGEPSLAQVPVIFLTSKGATVDKVRGLSLGAADWVTKPFDVEEVIARVQVQLRLRELTQSLERANEELRQKQAELEQDLRAAADIQKALLPQGPMELPHLSGAAFFLPAQAVGGDLFQFQRLDATRACAWMLDVSGHGVPSAMVTVSVAQSISAARPLAPAQVMALLEQEYPIERFDRFFTLAYLLFDLWRKRMKVSSAGHPPPILIRGGALRDLVSGGPLIGIGNGQFAEEEHELEDSDRLVIYTDGVVEMENAREEQLGLEGLHRLLLDTEALPLETAVAEMRKRLMAHGGGRQQADDVTLLVLEWHDGLALPFLLSPTLPAVSRSAERLREHWRSCGVPQKAAEQIELAFVEAATNIVLHGKPPADIVVESVYAEGSVTLTLRDRGLPVPPGTPKETLPGPLEESGRGVFLIHTLMDEVKYRTLVDGNELWMRKSL